MFRQLRLKLTVLYAGLFCAALLVIGATAYGVVGANTQRVVREQLQATGAVFDRIWQLRFEQLQDGARLSAQDYGFREAIATHDAATTASALANVRRRLGADLVFLVTPEGLVIAESGVGVASVSPGLQRSLDSEQAPSGVLAASGGLHQAVAAPIFAPNLLGWIVVGQHLDEEEMRALESLSAIPLNAVALARAQDGWGAVELPDRRIVSGFIDQALETATPRPGLIDAPSGRAIALVKPIRSLDGTSSVLVLRYPMSSALSPYRALFSTLIAIGIIGIAFLVMGTWLLAGSITRPLSTLETAARNLQQGVYDTVVVRTKDELSRLADSFNAMIGAIRDRERRITQLAYHDTETRLPNRLALERKLAASTQPKKLFLAAIGVDRFAHVRGAIGYAHAGALIRRLGARLARLAPECADGASLQRRAGCRVSG